LAWSSEGRLLAYTASTSLYGTCLYLWEEGTGTGSVGSVGPVNSSVTSPTWSPDNVNVAFAAIVGGHSHIYVLDTSKVGIVPQFGATSEVPGGEGGGGGGGGGGEEGGGEGEG
jgi:Tol biopolymer transport system component